MGAKRIAIARIVKPHGVRGKMKIDYFGENGDQFSTYREVVIEDPAGKPKTYTVAEVTSQPPRLILRLEGVERVEEVEPLIGKEIFVERGDLPGLDEDEYYWVDLLGMTVEAGEKKRIGTIKAILPTGAHDVFVIEGKKREIYLPATKEVIDSVDSKQGVMRVRRIEGLWEDEDEV